MARKTARTEKSDVGAKQRAYLKDTLEELRMTASGLAAEIGLAPSTFTRFMKEPEGSEKTLSASTMDKVERLRQVNSDSPIFTRAQAQWQSVREGDAEEINFADDDYGELAQAVRSLIGTRNGVTPWKLRTRALELEGFLPEDIVLVDVNAAPRPGDAVCAMVFDRNHTKAGAVMRLFQNAGPVNLLVPRTMDPAPQRPLVVDNDRVTIRGVLLPHRLKGKIAA